MFRSSGFSPGVGLLALLVVTFLGAVLLIGTERMLWYATG